MVGDRDIDVRRARARRRAAVLRRLVLIGSFVGLVCRADARYDRFRDSPWVEGAACSKFYDNPKWDELTQGLLCFDAACAPPAVRTFDCKSSSHAHSRSSR